MAIADWTLEDVSERMVEFALRLKDPVMADALLEEARQDTPIIAGILQQLAVLAASGRWPGKARDLALVRRDLLFVLALRDLEHEEHSATQARRLSAN